MTAADDVLEDDTVHLVLITRSYMTAVYAILIWDWIITVKSEYETIWKGRRTPVKYIFLFLRYYTIVSQGLSLFLVQSNWTEHTCHKFYLLQPFLGMWTIVFSDAILLLRCFAIWEQNNIILGGGLLGLAGMVVSCVFASLSTSPIPVPAGLSEFACSARPKPGSRVDSAMFLYPFCFETIITGLTIYRGLVYWKKGPFSSHLLERFIQGGVVYILCVETLNLINVVLMFQHGMPAIQSINAGATLILTSLFAQRLVLHLQGTIDNVTDVKSFGFLSTHAQPATSAPLGRHGIGSTGSGPGTGTLLLQKLGIIPVDEQTSRGDPNGHSPNGSGASDIRVLGTGADTTHVGLEFKKSKEIDAERGFSGLSKKESDATLSEQIYPITPVPAAVVQHYNNNDLLSRIRVNIETQRTYSQDMNPPIPMRPEVQPPPST